MKRHYDIVYLTNTPSFYKLNLCNALANSGVKLLLVLYGYGNEAVNTELSITSKWGFDYEFINYGDSSSRNKISTFYNLIKLMRGVQAKKILYSGWFVPEYNIYSFFSPKIKNVVVCESSELDVSISGIKGWIKKRIINRMAAACPSGQPHDRLFKSIGFKGDRYITGSVGIFYKPERQIKSSISSPLKFLYVGRLIDVKQVSMLVDVFNANGLPLTIVGKGILYHSLKSKAKSNISFLGFIDNNQLGKIYQTHDVFILPSKYEPWGLVVEEALYWGLPVIVSNRVGSKEDMVEKLKTGIVFDYKSSTALQEAIDTISKDYVQYKSAVDNIDFSQRDKNQIDAYLNLLHE